MWMGVSVVAGVTRGRGGRSLAVAVAVVEVVAIVAAITRGVRASSAWLLVAGIVSSLAPGHDDDDKAAEAVELASA